MVNEKENNKWFVETPWGKLALLAWGEPARPPVLLVHGIFDSAATFTPLVSLLRGDYYYVAFDLPGNGLSDPMPSSTLTHINFVEPIRLVVDHMEWDSFICIAHSMGFVISSFYNTLYPGKISKMVGLDPGFPLYFYKLSDDPVRWFNNNIAYYFEHHFGRPEIEYTFEEAVANMMQARGYTAEQASLMLSRCLTPAGPGNYRLSWDPKVKKLPVSPIPYETLYSTLTTKAPTLIFSTSFSNNESVRSRTSEILINLQKELKDYFIISAEGSHNVHFTNPERIVDDIIQFLETDYSVKSKL